MDLLIYDKQNKTFITIDYKILKYWDTFKIEQYSNYIKKKMIYKLKNINLN